jgi:hypothetical protein
MGNILSDFGKEAAANYASLFTDSERKQMYIMQAFIKHKGVDEARKASTKGLEIVYDAA